MTTSTAKEIKVVKSKAVTAIIGEAVAAAATAMDATRRAGIAFVESLKVNPTGLKPAQVLDVVKQGRALYADDFAGNHNLRAVFGDVITLQLAGDVAVSFEKDVTVAGKKAKQEVHTTAAEAVNLSKHDLRSAAKAVREDSGTARATGGGRAPRTPDTQKAGLAVEVFSIREMKSQLLGLFEHSKAPFDTLNKLLGEYGCSVVSSEDAKAFAKWKALNTKPAK